MNNIIEFLELNGNVKVNKIAEELLTMIAELQKGSSNRPGRTYLIDAKTNRPYAIFCYYHKQWELLSEVEYGTKVSSSTGYNTMCKIGVREWTKQQKEIKALGSEILAKIEAGELQVAEVADYKEARMLEIKQIVTETMPTGYATAEEVPQP